MQNAGIHPSRYSLREHGIRNINIAYWNLETAQLLERSVERREGLFERGGAYVVRTGQFTGRSPRDKFIVRDRITASTVNWGPVNQPMQPDKFEWLYAKMLAYLQGQDLFVQDCFAGADPMYRLPVRIIAQRAWHSLFARQLFIRPNPEETEDHIPEFTVFFIPGFHADSAQDQTNSEAAIVINFSRKLVLIAGTSYAGELKKSIFTVMNYLLPDRDVLPMHCSANMGSDGNVALFFGLSGTGKTTLSADPNRRLIGDDEHGWSGHGVFNFEGGCYAKTFRLSQEKEPQIWNAIRFGTILENVVIDTGTRLLDFNSDEITENTRAAFPLTFMHDAVIPSVAGHPSQILFLTADAFGVLPPVARLTAEQAMYHFLSGYTAKVAGTERGLGKEPKATFSACFGEPFIPRHPDVYARMLGERMRRHKTGCWLVNTGWIGGPYGAGRRIDLGYTRAIVNAIVERKLDKAPAKPHPVFHVMTPEAVPGVPSEVLDARRQWQDKEAYDEAALKLSALFHENFKRFEGVEPKIMSAAPAI
jgi:phosphoenolpyruvate carboxykinase (ATP)